MDAQRLVNDLILIPTEIERKKLCSRPHTTWDDVQIRTCGFGLVASAINATRAINELRPRRVILVGIAGLFSDREVPGAEHGFELGQAVCFSSVQVDGIGVGQGETFQSPIELAWDWLDPNDFPRSLALHRNNAEAKGDALLSVCSASASQSEALWRRRRFPEAIAEDMEGYAVAMSCRAAGIPLMIVRGFSNLVGQRDPSEWRFDDAIDSTARLLNRILGSR